MNIIYTSGDDRMDTDKEYSYLQFTDKEIQTIKCLDELIENFFELTNEYIVEKLQDIRRYLVISINERSNRDEG